MDNVVTTKTEPDFSKQTHLGRGVQATAFDTGKTNTIIKYVKLDGKDDPYAEFVRHISSSDNPHFPHIYNARLYYSKKHNSYYTIVEMEKLYPASNKKIRHAVAERAKELGLMEPDSSEESFFAMYDDFGGLDKLKQLASKTNNPKFAEAINTTVELVNQTKAGNSDARLDLHAGNFMVRITSTGPQLVINDPVVGRAHLF